MPVSNNTQTIKQIVEKELQTNKEAFEHRFWSKINRTGGEDACWPWLACAIAKNPKYNYSGYGVFTLRNNTQVYTHRLTWQMTYGDIPEGKWVIHSCDNTLCCNPKHLFIGTRQEHVLNKVKKGHLGYKLNQVKIAEIQRLYCESSISLHDLAERYNVCQSTIRLVLWGKYRDCQKIPIQRHWNTGIKLTASQSSDIIKQYAQGDITYRELADKYDVDTSMICKIVKGYRRQNAPEVIRAMQEVGIILP